RRTRLAARSAGSRRGVEVEAAAVAVRAPDAAPEHAEALIADHPAVAALGACPAVERIATSEIDLAPVRRVPVAVLEGAFAAEGARAAGAPARRVGAPRTRHACRRRATHVRIARVDAHDAH